MSSSDRKCEVHVESQSGPLEIHLLNHHLRSVATGRGRLHTTVPPGLYMLQYRAGSVMEQEYIKVDVDQPFRRLDLNLKFLSAAPVGGGATTHEYHAYPARSVSLSPHQRLGRGARLMVFARTLHEKGERARLPVRLDGLELCDETLHPIADLGRDGSRNEGDLEGWSAFCADVDPGGYVLRWPTASAARGGREVADSVDQSLWASANWTTIVFIGRDPESGELTRQGASIHLARPDVGWEPYAEPRVNQALELALSGMRSGAPAVPADLLALLLHAKFENPMLGIVGAHVLARRRRATPRLFHEVLSNLERLLPGHPDVVALAFLKPRETGANTAVAAVPWPPMLYSAYRAAIARDWVGDALIPEGSVAEQAAAVLRCEGPWSCWTTLAIDGVADEWEEIRDLSALMSMLAPDVAQAIRIATRVAPPLHPNNIRQSVTRQAARQVTQFIEGLDRFAGPVRRGGIALSDLSGLGLPMSTVKRTLEGLAVAAADRPGLAPTLPRYSSVSNFEDMPAILLPGPVLSGTARRVRPLHDQMLVRRTEPRQQILVGIVIPDIAKEKPLEGEVIAVGKGKVLENGTRVRMEVKAGDKILFGKYAGAEIKLEGEEYLLLTEDEVLAIIG
jgi:chaperonin GroES